MTAYRNQRVKRSGWSWMGTLSTVLDEIEVCFIPHLYLTSGETEAELLAMAPGIVPLLYSFWGVVFFIRPCTHLKQVFRLKRCLPTAHDNAQGLPSILCSLPSLLLLPRLVSPLLPPFIFSADCQASPLTELFTALASCHPPLCCFLGSHPSEFFAR